MAGSSSPDRPTGTVASLQHRSMAFSGNILLLIAISVLCTVTVWCTWQVNSNLTVQLMETGSRLMETETRLKQAIERISRLEQGSAAAKVPEPIQQNDEPSLAALKLLSRRLAKTEQRLQRELAARTAEQIIEGTVNRLVNVPQIWSAIRLLEHGVQKASGDWTPMWPSPPEECSHFPRQLPLRHYHEHGRDQMLYGPMKKMALLADKRRVLSVIESFNCPNLATIRQYAVWDRSNLTTSMNLSALPSKNYILKANFAAGFLIFVKNGIIVNIVTPAEHRLHRTADETHSQIGKPVTDKVVIQYYSWVLTTQYRGCIEPHYAFIDKLIIAEELKVSRANGDTPEDFKFLSSMGKVLAVQVLFNRTMDFKMAYATPEFRIRRDWGRLDGKEVPPDEEILRVKPNDRVWKNMVAAAECLSRKVYEWAGLRFARIDLYDLDDQATFGEITLTPAGGLQVLEDKASMEISRMLPFQ